MGAPTGRRGFDAVVVGAGCVGMCCALALAEAGLEVALVERGLPGAANTTKTGGGVRQQFAAPTSIRMSQLSEPFWAGFGDRFGVDPAFVACGYLFLAGDARGVNGLRLQAGVHAEAGVDSDFFDRDGLVAAWPWLNGTDFIGGCFRQRDGWLDHHRVVQGLTAGLSGSGVTLLTGTHALAVVTAGGRAEGVRTDRETLVSPTVVVATGPWTGLLDDLGVGIPVVGRRHQLLVVDPTHPLPRGVPWLIDVERQVHQRPDIGRGVLVGGFLGHDEPAGADDHDPRPDPSWAKAVLRQAEASFGLLGASPTFRRGWAGLYPGTPDRLPVIDEVFPGVVAAMGFAGTGLMHSPAAGVLVTELLTAGGLTSIDSGVLSLERFTSGRVAETTGF